MGRFWSPTRDKWPEFEQRLGESEAVHLHRPQLVTQATHSPTEAEELKLATSMISSIKSPISALQILEFLGATTTLPCQTTSIIMATSTKVRFEFTMTPNEFGRELHTFAMVPNTLIRKDFHQLTKQKDSEFFRQMTNALGQICFALRPLYQGMSKKECITCGKATDFALTLPTPFLTLIDPHVQVAVISCCEDKAECYTPAKQTRRDQIKAQDDERDRAAAEKREEQRKNYVPGRVCEVCHATEGLKFCQGCKFLAYCGKEHQTQDWVKGHKSLCGLCKIMAAERDKKWGGTWMLLFVLGVWWERGHIIGRRLGLEYRTWQRGRWACLQSCDIRLSLHRFLHFRHGFEVGIWAASTVVIFTSIFLCKTKIHQLCVRLFSYEAFKQVKMSRNIATCDAINDSLSIFQP